MKLKNISVYPLSHIFSPSISMCLESTWVNHWLERKWPKCSLNFHLITCEMWKCVWVSPVWCTLEGCFGPSQFISTPFPLQTTSCPCSLYHRFPRSWAQNHSFILYSSCPLDSHIPSFVISSVSILMKSRISLFPFLL